MIKLKQERGWVKATITRAAESVSEAHTWSVDSLQQRLKKLEEAYNELHTLSQALYAYSDEEGFVDPMNDIGPYELKYFETHGKLCQAIRDKAANHSRISDQDHTLERLTQQQETFIERMAQVDSSPQLASIKVPTFSGNYMDWPSFRDLFKSAIAKKTSLTNVQRFHYLKTFLSGDAQQLIKHLAITEDNYSTAWERLEKRYDRKQLIVKSYVQTFFSLTSAQSSHVGSLRKLSDSADEILRGLDALDITGRDPWVIQLLLNKVDDDTKRAWAALGDGKTDETLVKFLEFLAHRCDTLESLPIARPQRKAVLSHHVSSKVVPIEKTPQISHNCILCNQQHNLSQCAQFKSLDVAARRTYLKTHNLCYNCLSETHRVQNCLSQFRCRKCRGMHHTLVHIDQQQVVNNTNKSIPHSNGVVPDYKDKESAVVANNTIIANHSSNVSSTLLPTILPTAIAIIQDSTGRSLQCRMLLDSGSMVSFATETLIQRLGVCRSNARIPVSGIAACAAGVSRGQADLVLQSCTSPESLKIQVLILSKLTASLPCDFVNIPTNEISSLNLADPSYASPGTIDILIGADFLGEVYTGERRTFTNNSLVAMHTIFGWVLLGPCKQGEVSVPLIATTNHASVNIDYLAHRFMESEAIQCKIATEFDDPIEVHFQNTHTRDDSGSYIVCYPFKKDTPPIAETRNQALKRFYQIERRMSTNEELRSQYSQFMAEYESLGHMKQIPEEESRIESSQCFYLAHHAVLRPDSSTTKCRVVFDGSCKDADGVSLNDRLHVGPIILHDLLSVALRFRKHRYVMTADVEKMFRGIKLARQHQDFQRIVWRETPTVPVKDYRLLTVTYGLAPSPFLANRVMRQLALDYQNEFEVASKVLLNDIYVDDILTGANTVDEAIALKDSLIQLLAKAHLNLKKWSSNCYPLLKSLPAESCEFQPVSLEQHDNKCIKILGLQWNPASDELMVKVTTPNNTIATKRVVLSEMSKIYDPMGIVAPTVILFKTLFQESWYHALGWDDELPPDLANRWQQYLNELPHLASVKVPRQIVIDQSTIELHGFADASSIACAAVIYSRFKHGGQLKTNLIAAKTRVAPLKSISIPRMELNAAVLLVRLLERIKSSLHFRNFNVYLWTDSQIVLYWLSSTPRRWQTFISNRTSEILEAAPRQLWRHVRSQDNPADCASRGLQPSKLITHELWWHGPRWLVLPEEEWPVSKIDADKCIQEFNELLEERKTYPITCCIAASESVIDVLINKCSFWMHLIRVYAYCRRCTLILKGNSPTTEYLSGQELEESKKRLIRHVQGTAFAEDIKHLTKFKETSKQSSLVSLSAFIDDEGIMRVGGRLKNSTLNYNIRHPIILPKNNHLSLLIVRYIHVQNLHPGVDATFNLLRQQFWILGSRGLVRKVVHQCIVCFKQKRATSHQLMGDLPYYRAQANRCFLHCGLDYAGPISIKNSRGRNPKIFKAWFSIFVCMSTKAIHIELVSDLTTDAFLAAFRRFVARRGKPSDLYSDNASTFQGGKRKLNELFESALSQTNIATIAESLSNDGTNWHFIPPLSPHFGGLWESGVRSIKLHLKRVIGETILTFEELYTVLTQIEAILNSRPLGPISDTTIDPLTPAHFLIGEPYTAIPEPTLLEINPHRLQIWRNLQAMVQGFWKRWHVEYLTSLQQRSKWSQKQPNIKLDDLVIIKEPHLPPSKWILGRITSVFPGKDGAIRVVKIRTKTGEYTRPIIKVAPLPCSEQ